MCLASIISSKPKWVRREVCVCGTRYQLDMEILRLAWNMHTLIAGSTSIVSGRLCRRKQNPHLHRRQHLAHVAVYNMPWSVMGDYRLCCNGRPHRRNCVSSSTHSIITLHWDQTLCWQFTQCCPWGSTQTPATAELYSIIWGFARKGTWLHKFNT